MESELRHQLLRAAVREHVFLKQAHADLSPSDFPQPEERIVADVALRFFQKYEQPIGMMLRTWAGEQAEKEHFGSERKKKLDKLLDLMHDGSLQNIPYKVLVDHAQKLHQERFYQDAVEEIITHHEKGTLDHTALQDVVEKARHQLTTSGYITRDYNKEAMDRIERREKWDEGETYPKLMIDELDRRIRIIGRGQVAMWVAPPSGGKGLALVQVTKAYALQGLNVLHLTLEDPLIEVENRLDGSVTGIPLSDLRRFPNRFKNRWKAFRKHLRGKIRIIDGTDEEWTVTKIQKAWENLHQQGFTADAIVIDYDDEIVCEKQFKGESARRLEFAEIYKRLRKLAARLNVIIWTAAQPGRQAEVKKVLMGKDVAEDYSKVRKVFLAIGIGMDPAQKNIRYLYIMKHRLDKSKFMVTIASDYACGKFYDAEASMKLPKPKKEA